MITTKIKEFFEMSYWRFVSFKKKGLNNDHYKYFFTNYFDLSDSFYKEKKILDIGCGPRGSLEWADMTSERIGLDPLADKYLKMGAKEHKMKYVKGYIEKMPFETNYFDIVSSFNSLDHVENMSAACIEINRVLKKGGLFLLIVNIHKHPTLTEPHTINWDFVKTHFPNLEVVKESHLQEVEKNKIYHNLRINKKISDPQSPTGVLTCILRKKN